MKKQYVSLTVVLVFLLFRPCLGQRVVYGGVYAPSEDWVKPTEQPYRQDICLNGLWQFQPISLPATFKEGVDPVPDLPSAGKRGWEKTPIRIPSPWNVNSFADKNGQGGDFRCYPSYPREWENIKMGWLQKKFVVPADWKGKDIRLHFEAVAGDAEIIINGKPAGHHFGIFLPFDIDVTGLVLLGKENEITIGIRKASLFDHRSEYGRRTYQAGSFWGQHIAGIWQDVYLVAVPKISVSDVYIRPLLNEDKLVAEVTVNNNNDKDIEVKVDAGVYPWISQKEKDGPGAPVPGSELASGASLEIPAVSQLVPAHGSARVVLSTLVRDRLKPWFPGTPNLYGLIVHLNTGSQVTDSKYTRFGWRQTTFKGGQFLLNGKPFVMKGDSWHFLGIPQMTRRYAWAWFTALHNANLNAVRLHAEPYPSFYLDVADEMGILVLDETAMWASDGGPKLDDTAYWKDSEKHITELVLRDRNHPSVFGWSVSNEIMPIVRGVMHNPPGMMDNLIKHYGIWADICRKSDPSRPWISADGEDDGGGKLPTYVVHYGGAEAMERGEKSGKPWGVGEAGNAYYGTPEQVAETNGERAYQSFEGRMEGVAASSYQSLVLQREKQAVYRSVFNLVWYGLQPLALGMKDTTKPPDITDGVFFTSFKEGQPGVQPERLGPYCTTLNPGYDPSLPLYKTWPLFDAIHDASAEPPLPCKWVPGKPVISEMPAIHPVKSIRVMGGSGSRLSSELKRVGVPVDKLNTTAIPQLLFIDGVNPPDIGTRALIDQVITGGGTVMVWGAEQNRIKKLNDLLPAPLELTSRTASSLVPETPDNITAGITPSDLYFSELHPAEIISQGLSGPLAAQSTVLLSACNTDWLKWNKQPEYAKTAMVLRSERETKPSGIALMMTKTGNGRLLVTTLPAAPRLIKAEKVVRKLLTNLGIPLETGTDAGNPLLKTGDIVRTLACGSFPVNSIQDGASQNFIDPVKGETIQSNTVTEGKTWRLLYNESGVFDFNKVSWSGPSQNAAAYLSFWVSSPRSLEDLLLEPNIPTVNLELATDDAVQVWLNGKLVLQNIRKGSFEEGKAKSEALKLRQGWNHFLIKVIKTTRGWQFSGRLTSNQPDFLATLGSALEKP